MSTIAQDSTRVNKYNQFKSNLDLLTEVFINGDQLVRNGNLLLTMVSTEIDSGEETSWTKQDFNDMLNLRNLTLAPIMQNASFAAEFIPYIIL